MHFCKANVAIGDDNNNIMVRSEFAPVSWPEVEILRIIHGSEAVTEVVPFARVNQTAKEERERLALIYGEGPCMQLWGGKNPPRELEAPDAKLPAGVTFSWKNPLTMAIETIGGQEEPAAAELVDRAPSGQFTKKK